MNLNHFTGKSCLPVAVADFSKGSQRVGGVGLTNLTCRWVMGTNVLHQDEVLGLIALGCHQIMSSLRIEGVITGSLETGWYCTWSISGLQVFTVCCAMNWGNEKLWLRLMA